MKHQLITTSSLLKLSKDQNLCSKPGRQELNLGRLGWIGRGQHYKSITMQDTISLHNQEKIIKSWCSYHISFYSFTRDLTLRKCLTLILRCQFLFTLILGFRRYLLVFWVYWYWWLKGINPNSIGLRPSEL